MRTYPFIALEGLDGTGKTTVSEAIADNLRSQGLPVSVIHTPTEPHSLVSRAVIEDCSLLSRFYFFLSAVVSASEEVRKMKTSGVVICDRYIYSTLAYHRAFGVSVDVNYEHLDLVMPELSILLDVADEEERRRRITTRGNNTGADLRARDDSELIKRIKQEYARFPALTRIESGAPVDKVALHIIEMLKSVINYK